MAVILKNSIFLHIPKCGGTAVRKALESVPGLVLRETHYTDLVAHSGWGHTHEIPTCDPAWGKPCFCFVRDPVAWYRSWWAYRKQWSTDTSLMFDILTDAPTFDEFILNVRRAYPQGWLTDFYRMYTRHCRAVGRCDSGLPGDLYDALVACGESESDASAASCALALHNATAREFIDRAVLTTDIVNSIICLEPAVYMQWFRDYLYSYNLQICFGEIATP